MEIQQYENDINRLAFIDFEHNAQDLEARHRAYANESDKQAIVSSILIVQCVLVCLCLYV